MIISRTPFRISFFGGGTDYPEWYRHHGGAVISTTIDKYCYLSVRYLPPFFEHKYRVVWSHLENQKCIDDIQHPVVREVLRYMGLERGLEVHYVGDLPARSGMGSSSSFTVGLLHALYALQGRMPDTRRLMEEAIKVEQELLRETVGSQDQASAAYGGLNRILFQPQGEISVQPVLLPGSRRKALSDHLMLFYTGIVRTASNVASGYVSDLRAKKRQLRIMRDLVDESLELLTSGAPLVDFGVLLDEAWQVKRSLGAAVTNPEVDELYAKARSAGAVGGKLTGAGGGGFMLLFVPPDKQASVREALAELVHVPFGMESSGSQIIFCDHEQDYADQEWEREAYPIKAFRELKEVDSASAPGYVIPAPVGVDQPTTAEPVAPG